MKESNPIDELVHSLASPLNNVRLQLGLIRQNAGRKDCERVDSADLEVQRAQEIVIAVAEATSVGQMAACKLSELANALSLHWPEMTNTAKRTVSIPLSTDRARMLATLFVEGCNSLTTVSSAMLQVSGDVLIRVEGIFDPVQTTRALRLTHVGADGRAELTLAKARLMSIVAGGSIELADGALVLRLPVEAK